jgi:hypothetical protein
MFNNSLPVSSLFCKISLLCLPHCLPARIHCTFCSSAFCALCAIPIQCTFCLLSISAAALHLLLHTCITHNSNNPNLFFVPHSYTPCASCACSVCNGSACSACRVLCLFIMATLQLLCLFSHLSIITGCHNQIPSPHHQLRFFIFCYSRAQLSVAVTGSNAHPAVNRLHEQSLFYWQIP